MDERLKFVARLIQQISSIPSIEPNQAYYPRQTSSNHDMRIGLRESRCGLQRNR